MQALVYFIYNYLNHLLETCMCRCLVDMSMYVFLNSYKYVSFCFILLPMQHYITHWKLHWYTYSTTNRSLYKKMWEIVLNYDHLLEIIIIKLLKHYSFGSELAYLM